MKATITNHRNHCPIQCTKFCTYRGWQSKTHCTQTTRGNIASGFIKLCVSTSNHLVLSHIGYHNRIALSDFIYISNHFRHSHFLRTWIHFRLNTLFIFLFCIICENFQPLRPIFLIYTQCKQWKCFLTITPNTYRCFYIFINLRWINI